MEPPSHIIDFGSEQGPVLTLSLSLSAALSPSSLCSRIETFIAGHLLRTNADQDQISPNSAIGSCSVHPFFSNLIALTTDLRGLTTERDSSKV